MIFKTNCKSKDTLRVDRLVCTCKYKESGDWREKLNTGALFECGSFFMVYKYA